MPPTPEESAAFLRAHEATKRGAKTKFIIPGISREEAVRRYESTAYFADRGLRDLALRAIAGATGRAIGPGDAMPCMIWRGGAGDTEGGVRFKGTIGDFIQHVLEARAQEIAPKRRGWVVTPTSNKDGHRTNASTTAVHAVNLDCDGRGTWDPLLSVLDALGFAYIVYQSGGWSPAAPKWHALIPLTRPFDTSSAEKCESWKRAYEATRIVFGTVAELRGEGFDPSVGTPAAPVFVCERRSAEDSPRQIRWKTGKTLDVEALARELPAIPEKSGDGHEQPREVVELDDDRLREIVDALAPVTSSVPSGRRDLYLSLAGTLLDRGIIPSDVRAIIEAVSLHYPRRDAEKHRDNMHSAETTIGKWERGEPHTQIGTLNDIWPNVAEALDSVLPSRDVVAMEGLLDRCASRREGASLPVEETESSKVDTWAASIPTQTIESVRKRLLCLRTRKMASTSREEKIRGAILGAMLDGEDLVPRIVHEDGRAEIAVINDREIDRNGAIRIAMGIAAFRLPIGTPLEPVLVLARKSLTKMCLPGERMSDLEDIAKQAFLGALGKKVEKWKEKVEETESFLDEWSKKTRVTQRTR